MDIIQGRIRVGEAMAKSAVPIGYTPPSLRKRLAQQLAERRQQVETLEQAIALLDKAPDTEQLLDLLGRVGGF